MGEKFDNVVYGWCAMDGMGGGEVASKFEKKYCVIYECHHIDYCLQTPSPPLPFLLHVT